MKRLALGIILLCAAGPSWAIRVEKLEGAMVAGVRPVEVVAEQLLVRFSSQTTLAQREAALSSLGGRLVQEHASIGWSLASLPSGMKVSSGANLVRGLPGVEAVEPNQVHRPNLVPNDPLVSSQWALSQINAFGAWEYEVGTSCRTTIAIIDAGIDSTQNELSGKMTGLSHQTCPPGSLVPDCSSDTASPTVACNHATHVAGVAAAAGNNGMQIAGVAWGSEAKILSLRVYTPTDCSANCADNGSNVCATDDNAMISALEFLIPLENTATYGKIVANISSGGAGACSQSMADALTAALTAGIPVSISAGNDGGLVNSPANCAAIPEVSAIGGVFPTAATDSTNHIASFSSNGSTMAAYGVAAPGVAVLTTDLSNGTVNASGTSFSAPHVAGLAALIIAARPDCRGLNCATFAYNTIRGGAESIGASSSLQGAGRINALRSLRLAVNGTLAGFEGEQKAAAFPNPFRTSQSGSVSFSIPPSLQGGNATIKIYTVAGELVQKLTGLTWDGKNTAGRFVATGTYIFVVSTDKGTTRGRVAVIR